MSLTPFDQSRLTSHEVEKYHFHKGKCLAIPLLLLVTVPWRWLMGLLIVLVRSYKSQHNEHPDQFASTLILRILSTHQTYLVWTILKTKRPSIILVLSTHPRGGRFSLRYLDSDQSIVE